MCNYFHITSSKHGSFLVGKFSEHVKQSDFLVSRMGVFEGSSRVGTLGRLFLLIRIMGYRNHQLLLEYMCLIPDVIDTTCNPIRQGNSRRPNRNHFSIVVFQFSLTFQLWTWNHYLFKDSLFYNVSSCHNEMKTCSCILCLGFSSLITKILLILTLLPKLFQWVYRQIRQWEEEILKFRFPYYPVGSFRRPEQQAA